MMRYLCLLATLLGSGVATFAGDEHPDISLQIGNSQGQGQTSGNHRLLPEQPDLGTVSESGSRPRSDQLAQRPESRAGIEEADDEAVEDTGPRHTEKIQLPEGWKWDRMVPGRASRQGDAIQLDTVNGRIWAGEGNRNRIVTDCPIGDKATALANVELVNAAGKWEQCGLLACHHDDSFVKLVLEHIDGKHHVILAWEIDGKRKVLAILQVPASRVDLRMEVDGDTVRGFWRSSPARAWNAVAETKLSSESPRYFMLFTQDGDPAQPRHALVRELSWLKTN